MKRTAGGNVLVCGNAVSAMLMRHATLILVILALGGCRSIAPASTSSGTTESAEHSPALTALIGALARATEMKERAGICNQIHDLGPEGQDFLVAALVDPAFRDKVWGNTDTGGPFVCTWMASAAFVPIGRNPLDTTIPMKEWQAFSKAGEEWKGRDDLTERLEARLAKDEAFVDGFLRETWRVYKVEECVDALISGRSTPASRNLARHFLRDYAKLNFEHDPQEPVESRPRDLREALAKWKREHYEGSEWQKSNQKRPERFRWLVQHDFPYRISQAKGEDLANLVILLATASTRNFRSCPDELQFGCVISIDYIEESWAALVDSTPYGARACEYLWRFHSLRYSRTVMEIVAKADLKDPQWKALHETIEKSLAPESIQWELGCGDVGWGAWLAGLRPHPLLVPTLLDLLGKTEWESAVMLALGKSGDPRARAPLVRLLKSDDYSTPGWAAQALGYLGDPAAEPDLIEALRPENGWRVVHACVALAKIGTRQALPALRPLTDEKQHWGALSVPEMAGRAVREIEAREKRQNAGPATGEEQPSLRQ